MNEEFDDLIKKSQKQSDLQHEKRKRMQKELREYNRPRLHYIFTLSFSEGSFLDLNSINGWYKYISLNIGLFNKFVKCKITQNAGYSENFNTEQFILNKIIRSFNSQMCECSFEGVYFEVFTDGKAFEVILDPLDKDLELEFSQHDSHKLEDFFKRWAGEVLVKSFSLDEYIDGRLEDFYDSIYDSVLDLNFHSFVIYTYPDNMENTAIEKLIGSRFIFPNKPILDNIWTNYSACIRDSRRGYPPFQEYSIHIKGHVPDDYSFERINCLEILYHHMNYWSMVHNLENFMGIIKEFQYLETYDLKIFIKKRDVFKRLISGKDIEHIEIESLGKIRRITSSFLNLGLKSNHRGLEVDASEQYLLRYIVGEYFFHFKNSKKDLTVKVLNNATEENIISLKEEFDGIWEDLEKRIENVIENTRDLERKYYQEYQLKHVEKTQELTILSILTAVLIFLISKLPLNLITQKNILVLWNYLKNLFFDYIY